jgi:CheY-like chemotaxis protein
MPGMQGIDLLKAVRALDLDVGTAPGHPDLVGQREQIVEAVIRQLQHLQGLILVEANAAVEYLLACLNQNVAHPYVSLNSPTHS